MRVTSVDALFANPLERRLAILLESGYRGHGPDRHVLAFVRRAPCGCGDGCTTCRFVGWRIRNERVVVHLDASTRASELRRFTKMGDVLTSTLFGDLVVEIVDDPVRLEEVRRENAARELELEDEWQRAVEAARRSSRTARLVTVALGLAGIGVALAWALDW